MSTYSSYSATGIVLNNFATQNPVTITSSGTLVDSAGGDIALWARGAYAWTIDNQGLIVAAGLQAAGAYLSDGGVLTNHSGGKIVATATASYGVVLAHGGTVTNQSSAVISGNIGVYAKPAAPAAVINAGTLTGANGPGIALLDGGSVTNQIGGTIAGYDGIFATNGTANVVNAGTARGVYGAVLLRGGGTVTNQSGGTISGALYGVKSTGSVALTLINQGSITGQTAAGAGMASGGWLSNAGTGVISGGNYGIEVKTDPATIVNAGLVSAQNVAGVGLFAGGAVNNSGRLLGHRYGVAATGSPATVTNQGSIVGSYGDGILLLDGGYVSNAGTGTILGDYFGVRMSGAAGSVANAGTIAASLTYSGTAAGTVQVSGVALVDGGYADNLAGGTIGGNFFGVLISGAAGNVNNAGSIVSTGTYYHNLPFDAAGVGLLAGGTVVNSGAIRGTWKGVEIGTVGANIGGTLFNQGFIYASNSGASTGAAVWIHGDGLISNASNGTIAGGPYGIVAYYQGDTVLNAGTIASPNGNGALLLDGGTVTNQAGGTIAGYTFGVKMTGTAGAVTNDGSIFSTATFNGSSGFDAAGVAVQAGGTVVNDGAIRATWKGVEIGTLGASTGGNLYNQGLIYASNASGNTGAAVWLHGPGEISNAATGTIAGGPFAIVSYYQTTVLNAGSIGATEFGVHAAGSATVINSGRITGGPGGGGVGAGVYLIAGGAVTNQASAVITGYHGVYATAGVATVVNAGTIASSGRYGIELNDGGSVTNAAGGRITGTAFGVEINSGGTVVDAGTISNIDFFGTGTNRLVLDPGAAAGSVTASDTASNTLELASSASAGTLSGLGSQYVGFAQITIDAGATWTLASAALPAGYTIADSGTLTNSGSLGSAVTLTAGGVLSNASGGIITGLGQRAAVTSAGIATVANAGTIGSATAADPYGVYLTGGGTFSNASGGIVQAGSIGVRLNGASAAVDNAGSIVAGNDGIYLHSTIWTLTNSGIVRSTTLDNGAYVNGGAGSITNSGTFSGHYAGLWLINVGAAVIDNTGTLVGGYDGLYVGGGNAMLTNRGLIASTTLDNGVYVRNGTATIANSGTISGAYDGLYFQGAAGTVTNAGTIAGAHDALQFAKGFASRLIVDAGAVFYGTVDGGNTLGSGASSTLELASSASAGTLSGLGSQYIGFSQITIDAGARWTLGTGSTLGIGQTLSNAGTLTIPAGNLVDTGVILNDGLVVADPGLVELGGSVSGTGTLAIDPATTLQLDQAVGSGQTITFADATGTLVLGDIGGFQGTFGSFSAGDQIFVAGATVASDAFVNNTLTLFAAGGGTIGTLAFLPGAATGGELFVNAQGGIGGSAPCFAAGTRIATEHGEVAVEDLRVGDRVRTVLGTGTAPIVWLGRRHADCARHPQRRQVWPVRIQAGAFGPAQPHRDLLLSPDHAVYVSGVLIPVKHLINGSTIAQLPVAQVTYYHLELAQHDVVLAEGLPAESFLDMKDGSNYARETSAAASGAVPLRADWPVQLWEAAGCAPLVVAGPELAAARALVAGFATTRQAA